MENRLEKKTEKENRERQGHRETTRRGKVITSVEPRTSSPLASVGMEQWGKKTNKKKPHTAHTQTESSHFTICLNSYTPQFYINTVKFNKKNISIYLLHIHSGHETITKVL